MQHALDYAHRGGQADVLFAGIPAKKPPVAVFESKATDNVVEKRKTHAETRKKVPRVATPWTVTKTAIGGFWGVRKTHAESRKQMPRVATPRTVTKTAIGGFWGVLHVSINQQRNPTCHGPTSLIPTCVSDKPPLAVF